MTLGDEDNANVENFNKMSQRNNTIECQLDNVIDGGQKPCDGENNSIHLIFKGIYIWHSKEDMEIKDRFEAQSTTSFLQMIFRMNSKEQGSPQSRTTNLELESNCLFFVPANTSNHLHQEFPDGTEVMGVHIEMPLFFELFTKDNDVFNSLKEKIQVGHLADLLSGAQPLTIAMKEVIHQILNCIRKDDCRCLFFHAKVIELLSLQLEQLEMATNGGPFSYQSLKEEELKRVYRVKEIIEQNPQKKYSLLGLAHAVGTNDATLKKHFKAVFGVTVFGYLHAYRMEQAKKQLLTSDLKISDIAQRAGYKHATHFSAAFKKYFGYLPTQLK